jgi:hypothetical protein
MVQNNDFIAYNSGFQIPSSPVGHRHSSSWIFDLNATKRDNRAELPVRGYKDEPKIRESFITFSVTTHMLLHEVSGSYCSVLQISVEDCLKDCTFVID